MKNYGKKLKKSLRKSLKKKRYKPGTIENEKSEKQDGDIVVIEEEQKNSSKSDSTKKSKTIGSLLSSSNTNLKYLSPYKNLIFLYYGFRLQ